MRRISLLVKLPVLLVLAVALTAGAGSILALYLGRSILRKEALETNIDNVEAYRSAVSFYLENARSLLETTASLPEITNFASSPLVDSTLHGLPSTVDRPKREVAARILKHSRVFEEIMLLRADGTVYLVEPFDYQIRLSRSDVSYAGWYKRLMATGQTVMSNLRISLATQRPTVILAVPVRAPGGQIIGIWAGALKLEELSRIGRAGSGGAPSQHYGYITDNRGLIIAHQTKPKYVTEQTDFSSVPPVRAALAGQQGTMQFINPIEGIEKLGAYTSLPNAGWAVVYVVATRAAFEPIESLTQRVVLASGGLALLLCAIGFGVVRRIVRPLDQLTGAARTIGTGDFTSRIQVKTGDEIERLADEFNRMAASLAEKDGQLRQRADQLEAANKELEAFSYSVSHDLRAPIRAIDGFSRILLDEYVSTLSPDAQRYLQLVRSNTQQMGHLVDDLLTFSRLSRQALRRDTVDPVALVRQSLEELRAEQEGRQVKILVGELPTCEGDPALLKQVWINLLSNALKFTRKREVAVIEIGSARIEDCKLQIADLPSVAGQSAISNLQSAIYFVRDNGVGFDMQYAHKLFGVFQRLHRAEEYEGTGVGLAIVQRIIHRHGGRVWAEAEVEKGASIYFTI